MMVVLTIQLMVQQIAILLLVSTRFGFWDHLDCISLFVASVLSGHVFLARLSRHVGVVTATCHKALGQ